MRYCVADNFIRERSAEGVDKVVSWIKHSGFDRTKALRVEMGVARESIEFFREEGCIPATAEDVETVFRVVDGAHRLGACLKLQGK